MIKVIVATILMITFIYRMGVLLSKLLEEENRVSKILVYGTIFSLAIFEIIGIPFSGFHWSGKILKLASLFIYSALILISFFYKRNIKIKVVKEKSISAVIAIVIVLLLAFTSAYLFTENADDSYYISTSLENILNNLNEKDASTGLALSSSQNNYKLTLYETYVGIFSQIFGIEPAIFFHVSITFIFIIISFCCYFTLTERFFEDNKKRCLLITTLAIIFLFSGFSNRLTGAFLLGRIWQGKAIFLNVIVPFIFYNLLDLETNTRKRIVLLWISAVAAVCLNPIAIYFVPIIYGLYGMILLTKRKISQILKLIIVLIPNIVLFILFIIISKTGVIAVQIDSSVNIDFLRTLKNFIGTGYHFYLFLICLISIIFVGDKNAKILFVFTPIFSIVFLLNPIMGSYVAKYITHSAVYWRLFWLLQMEICIAYTIIRVYELIKYKKLKVVFMITSIIIIMLTGEFLYTEKNGFKKHENLYKIPQFIINHTNYILEHSEGKQIVVAPPEPLHAVTMRQLINDIILFWSRDMYMEDPFLYIQNEETFDKAKIYNIYKDGKPSFSIEKFDELLERYEVDWLIIGSDDDELIDYLEKTKLEKQIEDDMYIVFKREE